MTTNKPDVQALIEEGRNAQKYAFSVCDTGNALIFRDLTDALSNLSGEAETELNQAVAKAELRGFNKGYAQADREWRQSGNGRGLV